jgi:hypothetical protein
MRYFICIASVMLALFVGSDQQQGKPNDSEQAAPANQGGTQQSLLFAQELPSPRPADQAAQEAQDRANKAANDANLVNFTHQLVIATFALAAIGVLQLLVFGYQARKLSQTVKAAGEQSQAMERHIDQAERSAKAMETIASVINFGNLAIMRSYLTVVIGSATYQEKGRGNPTSNLKRDHFCATLAIPRRGRSKYTLRLTSCPFLRPKISSFQFRTKNSLRMLGCWDRIRTPPCLELLKTLFHTLKSPILKKD